jgi:hypothetical protein
MSANRATIPDALHFLAQDKHVPGLLEPSPSDMEAYMMEVLVPSKRPRTR